MMKSCVVSIRSKEQNKDDVSTEDLRRLAVLPDYYYRVRDNNCFVDRLRKDYERKSVRTKFVVFLDRSYSDMVLCGYDTVMRLLL